MKNMTLTNKLIFIAVVALGIFSILGCGAAIAEGNGFAFTGNILNLIGLIGLSYNIIDDISEQWPIFFLVAAITIIVIGEIK